MKSKGKPEFVKKGEGINITPPKRSISKEVKKSPKTALGNITQKPRNKT